MMPTVAELPDDIDTLKAMVLATVEQRATMEAENSRIASEIAALKLINTTSDARIAELTAIVKTFERMLYGARSERMRRERLDDEPIETSCSTRSRPAGRRSAPNWRQRPRTS